MNDKVNKNEEQNSSHIIGITRKDCKCESCGKLFHFDHVKRHICEICSIVHCSNSCLKSHLNTIHKVSISYKCEICHKAFSCGSHLKKHIQQIHKSNKY